MADSFYLPTSQPDVFESTAATVGPWDPSLQHGGPPSALLARAVERTESSWPGTVVRMAVEILGPVPVSEVTVRSTVTRPGKNVELIEAELSAGGRAAAKARAWRIRTTELTLPETVPATEPPPTRPEGGDVALPVTAPFLQSMEMRLSCGSWTEPGAAACWMRQRIPLVADEEPSGLQRLMAVADCGNGLSSVLVPWADWMFINPDLTVHLERYPQGEWICLEAATAIDAGGFGLARSTLYDVTGAVGRGAQSLFVSTR
ncbi:MAG TPA: thioesterase family protein [Mycobacteriales bacterium]|nr:thioesterase family protein [Mycobacteriales bacterium]